MRTSEVRWELLYTWALSLSWQLHIWIRGSHPAVHVPSPGASLTWALLLTLLLAKLLMHDTTQCIVALERDLFWVASSGAFVHTFPVVSPAAFIICPTCFTVYVQVGYLPSSSSGQLGNDYLPSSSAMSLFRRSLITWSPGFISGDFIFNSVTAGIGMMEIGARQLNNWRLRKPPDLLPFCQPGVLSNTPIS